MDGWMDVWVDVWVDGWMDGLGALDGWMDWMDGSTQIDASECTASKQHHTTPHQELQSKDAWRINEIKKKEQSRLVEKEKE